MRIVCDFGNPRDGNCDRQAAFRVTTVFTNELQVSAWACAKHINLEGFLLVYPRFQNISVRVITIDDLPKKETVWEYVEPKDSEQKLEKVLENLSCTAMEYAASPWHENLCQCDSAVDHQGPHVCYHPGCRYMWSNHAQS